MRTNEIATSVVRLRVNGETHVLTLDNRTTLLDALRETIGLTGSKKGCDHGQCGACTVLVDGRRANSCLLFAVAVQDAGITTVEGLAEPDGTLHRLQRAFVDRDALQCGYCTPGQICSAAGVLAEAAAGWPSAVSAAQDVGPVAHDAGPVAHDAGPAAQDAGPAAQDAGPAAQDAGPAARGAGPAVLDAAEVRERMSGNLCRCGAYVNIVAAILDAAAATTDEEAG